LGLTNWTIWHPAVPPRPPLADCGGSSGFGRVAGLGVDGRGAGFRLDCRWGGAGGPLAACGASSTTCGGLRGLLGGRAGWPDSAWSVVGRVLGSTAAGDGPGGLWRLWPPLAAVGAPSEGPWGAGFTSLRLAAWRGASWPPLAAVEAPLEGPGGRVRAGWAFRLACRAAWWPFAAVRGWCEPAGPRIACRGTAVVGGAG